jgi:hypothetical protein
VAAVGAVVDPECILVEAKYPPAAASKIAAAIRIHFCAPEPDGSGVLKIGDEL